MLQALRRGAKSWLAKGLLMVLAGAFGLWGINDIFRGTSVESAVASVGDYEIPVNDFDRELRADMRNQGRQSNTELTLEQARAIGLTQNVLEGMINRAALDSEVKKLGLTVDNDSVAAEIKALPQFSAAGGSFNRALFQEILSQNGMSEQGFEQGMRADMARSQLVGGIVGGFNVPPSMVRMLYYANNQTRIAEYVVLKPEHLGPIRSPSEDEMMRYYKANASRFSTPEYREIEYIPIELEQFTGKVQVSEADIRKEYDTNKDSYVRAEQREIEQINFPSRETAGTASQKIASGGSFSDVAHGMGLSDDDIKLGTFAKSGLDPRLAGAVFSIPEGGVTQPVQGPFGWVILRVTKVTPGVNKTFEELRETLRQQLAKGQAMQKMIDVANALEDTRAGGASLAEAAKTNGLPVIHIAAVDQNGLAPDGSKVSLPGAANFLKQVFAAEPGEEGDTFQTDEEHSYIVRVIGVRPPAPKPLDQVREQVVKEWNDAERAKALAARAKDLTEKAQSAGTLASAASALATQPAKSSPLRRDSASETFSLPVLSQLFATPPGGVVYGPLGKGLGYVIARVAEVRMPDPSADQAGFENSVRETGQQIQGDLIASLANSARAVEGVKIHQTAYNRVVGGSQ